MSIMLADIVSNEFLIILYTYQMYYRESSYQKHDDETKDRQTWPSNYSYQRYYGTQNNLHIYSTRIKDHRYQEGKITLQLGTHDHSKYIEICHKTTIQTQATNRHQRRYPSMARLHVVERRHSLIPPHLTYQSEPHIFLLVFRLGRGI